MTTPKSPEDDVVFYRSTGDISIESNGLSDMFPGLFKNMQPKSPEQIQQELIQLGNSYHWDFSHKDLDSFLRSSMASLLCYMAERMPRNGEYFEASATNAYKKGTGDCRTLLIEEARKITDGV